MNTIVMEGLIVCLFIGKYKLRGIIWNSSEKEWKLYSKLIE